MDEQGPSSNNKIDGDSPPDLELFKFLMRNVIEEIYHNGLANYVTEQMLEEGLRYVLEEQMKNMKVLEEKSGEKGNHMHSDEYYQEVILAFLTYINTQLVDALPASEEDLGADQLNTMDKSKEVMEKMFRKDSDGSSSLEDEDDETFDEEYLEEKAAFEKAHRCTKAGNYKMTHSNFKKAFADTPGEKPDREFMDKYHSLLTKNQNKEADIQKIDLKYERNRLCRGLRYFDKAEFNYYRGYEDENERLFDAVSFYSKFEVMRNAICWDDALLRSVVKNTKDPSFVPTIADIIAICDDFDKYQQKFNDDCYEINYYVVKELAGAMDSIIFNTELWKEENLLVYDTYFRDSGPICVYSDPHDWFIDTLLLFEGIRLVKIEAGDASGLTYFESDFFDNHCFEMIRWKYKILWRGADDVPDTPLATLVRIKERCKKEYVDNYTVLPEHMMIVEDDEVLDFIKIVASSMFKISRPDDASRNTEDWDAQEVFVNNIRTLENLRKETAKKKNANIQKANVRKMINREMRTKYASIRDAYNESEGTKTFVAAKEYLDAVEQIASFKTRSFGQKHVANLKKYFNHLISQLEMIRFGDACLGTLEEDLESFYIADENCYHDVKKVNTMTVMHPYFMKITKSMELKKKSQNKDEIQAKYDAAIEELKSDFHAYLERLPINFSINSRQTYMKLMTNIVRKLGSIDAIKNEEKNNAGVEKRIVSDLLNRSDILSRYMMQETEDPLKMPKNQKELSELYYSIYKRVKHDHVTKNMILTTTQREIDNAAKDSMMMSLIYCNSDRPKYDCLKGKKRVTLKSNRHQATKQVPKWKMPDVNKIVDEATTSRVKENASKGKEAAPQVKGAPTKTSSPDIVEIREVIPPTTQNLSFPNIISVVEKEQELVSSDTESSISSFSVTSSRKRQMELRKPSPDQYPESDYSVNDDIDGEGEDEDEEESEEEVEGEAEDEAPVLIPNGAQIVEIERSQLPEEKKEPFNNTHLPFTFNMSSYDLPTPPAPFNLASSFVKPTLPPYRIKKVTVANAPSSKMDRELESVDEVLDYNVGFMNEINPSTIQHLNISDKERGLLDQDRSSYNERIAKQLSKQSTITFSVDSINMVGADASTVVVNYITFMDLYEQVYKFLRITPTYDDVEMEFIWGRIMKRVCQDSPLKGGIYIRIDKGSKEVQEMLVGPPVESVFVQEVSIRDFLITKEEKMMKAKAEYAENLKLLPELVQVSDHPSRPFSSCISELNNNFVDEDGVTHDISQIAMRLGQNLIAAFPGPPPVSEDLCNLVSNTIKQANLDAQVAKLKYEVLKHSK
uniref:Ubiquitinyl hydrolase 1 n=1 Tax=Rhabditophanes sp. KR3021 TaxID=114890 RepID=A0AC35UD51_9BILA